MNANVGLSKTLFTAVQILDCTGSEPYPGEVLMEGNRIAEVVRSPAQATRHDAAVVDGRGATLMSWLKEMKKRGIRILGGGDYGFFVTPHGENARDMEHLIRYCDFTPMEALLSMTKHGGAAMDLPNELGQIQPGFLADLLLVAGNPLADPTLLLDRNKLLAVVKNGEFHRRLV